MKVMIEVEFSAADMARMMKAYPYPSIESAVQSEVSYALHLGGYEDGTNAVRVVSVEQVTPRKPYTPPTLTPIDVLTFGEMVKNDTALFGDEDDDAIDDDDPDEAESLAIAAQRRAAALAKRDITIVVLVDAGAACMADGLFGSMRHSLTGCELIRDLPKTDAVGNRSLCLEMRAPIALASSEIPSMAEVA